MGARTDAARAEVLDARSGLEEEVVRLEAAGRAAIDIPARVRRDPVRVVGAAGGAAYLLLGGPRRTLRGIRRAILGPEANLPKSMLPKEVDKTLKKLGSDGDKVRGTLEREFANYLDERAPQRRQSDLFGQAVSLASTALKPLSRGFGLRLAERALEGDGEGFAEGLRRARERIAASMAPRSDVPATKPIAAPATKPIAAPTARPIAAPATKPIGAPAAMPPAATAAKPAPAAGGPIGASAKPASGPPPGAAKPQPGAAKSTPGTTESTPGASDQAPL